MRDEGNKEDENSYGYIFLSSSRRENETRAFRETHLTRERTFKTTIDRQRKTLEKMCSPYGTGPTCCAPRVGLEILQDHGFYNQSRFWLFFPGFLSSSSREKEEEEYSKRAALALMPSSLLLLLQPPSSLFLLSLSSTTAQ